MCFTFEHSVLLFDIGVMLNRKDLIQQTETIWWRLKMKVSTDDQARIIRQVEIKLNIYRQMEPSFVGACYKSLNDKWNQMHSPAERTNSNPYYYLFHIFLNLLMDINDKKYWPLMNDIHIQNFILIDPETLVMIANTLSTRDDRGFSMYKVYAMLYSYRPRFHPNTYCFALFCSKFPSPYYGEEITPCRKTYTIWKGRGNDE